MRRRRWALLGAAALALMCGAPAAAAVSTVSAVSGAERITAYDVVLGIEADGTLTVRESIDYDFGTNERHGIIRDIPVRVPYDSDTDRVYELADVRVSSPSGAPSDVDRSESGGTASLRIGNPDRTVSGRQTYVIEYVVTGALNAFDDHDELYWNAIGDSWDVAIEQATVQVDAPAVIARSACFAGPSGSNLPCDSLRADGARVVAAHGAGLEPYSAFTVVVGLPKGAVSATGPVLEERPTLRRSLTPNLLTGTLAAMVLVPGLLGIGWLVGTRGRDRRYAGLTPGLTAGPDAPEEPVPLVGAGPVAVQFQPPEGLRPGQLGTLLDERANVLDVTATIVDLAVRGHLRIEELAREHWFSSRDWRLVRLPGGEGALLTYEKLLYDGLFATGEEVLLSSLKKTFAARLKKVQTALYEDVTRAGWFRGRPDKVRGGWQAAGFLLTLAGGWLTFALGRQLHWAPVGIAVTVLGVVLFLVGRRMPARTGRGSAVLAQARGFRQYIRTAEAEQLRYEEGQDVFSRYLAFAVVFGEVDRWVKVFGPLAAATATPGTTGAMSPAWYSGPDGWSPDRFADSLGGFSSAAAGSLASATASSSGSSGFGGGGSSGGGGGGGGGSSW